MLGSQHPDKSAVGRKRTDSASASITEKSNLQLLNEVEAMLSLPAEEMDTDRIEEYLSLLQKKAPVTEHYDPEEKWAKLEESHPLIFEEEPNSCKSDLAAEARNRHGNRTRRSFSRVFRAAAIATAAAFCFIITASAMGFQPVQAVLRWAEGIIQIYCAMIVSMHQRCCSTTALRCVIVNPFFIFSTTSFPSFKCIVLRLRPQFP